MEELERLKAELEATEKAIQEVREAKLEKLRQDREARMRQVEEIEAAKTPEEKAAELQAIIAQQKARLAELTAE